MEMDTDYIGGEDTVENLILREEPNAPLESALGLELHHPIMSMLGGNGVQIKREREGRWYNNST